MQHVNEKNRRNSKIDEIRIIKDLNVLKIFEGNNERNKRMKQEEYRHDCNLSYNKSKFIQSKITQNYETQLGNSQK